MKMKKTTLLATALIAITTPFALADETGKEKKKDNAAANTEKADKKKDDKKSKAGDEKSGDAKAGDEKSEADAATEVVIKPDPTTSMKWANNEFTVKAGAKVKLTLNNDSNIPLQHNLLILKPGTLQKVGALANAMLSDPNAMANNYIPTSTDILHHTKLVAAGASETIEFTAPDEAGDYPYTCTFPGHWAVMQGIMKVEE